MGKGTGDYALALAVAPIPAHDGGGRPSALYKPRRRLSALFNLSVIVLVMPGVAFAIYEGASASPIMQRILLAIGLAVLGISCGYVLRTVLQRARGRHRRIRTGLAWLSVRSLTALAGALAGRGRSALLQEWTAHLAGESGQDPASWAKVQQAIGFLAAGMGYRCSDWADAAWRPADAVLRSRVLSGLFVAVPTIVVGVTVLTHKGTMTVLTSFGSIFGVGTFLSGVIKAARWYRDAEPPEPMARQAKK